MWPSVITGLIWGGLWRSLSKDLLRSKTGSLFITTEKSYLGKALGVRSLLRLFFVFCYFYTDAAIGDVFVVEFFDGE